MREAIRAHWPGNRVLLLEDLDLAHDEALHARDAVAWAGWVSGNQEQSRGTPSHLMREAISMQSRGTPSHLRVRIARVGERSHLFRELVILLLVLPRLGEVAVFEVDDRLA